MAFAMKDGGKCEVGYTSRLVGGTTSPILVRWHGMATGRPEELLARFIPRPPLIASARSVAVAG